jgi:uncharacterized membrane protein
LIATEWYMVVLRLIHIVGGVAWAGSIVLFVLFIQPSAAAIAPAGAPFMGELLGKRRLVDRIIAVGSITVVAGVLIYWKDWHNYSSFSVWIHTHFGLALTVGALSAIAALGTGIFGTRPNVERFLALGREVAASGAPPTPEVAAEIGAIQGRLKILARVGLGLLLTAVILMSTARYL